MSERKGAVGKGGGQKKRGIACLLHDKLKGKGEGPGRKEGRRQHPVTGENIWLR